FSVGTETFAQLVTILVIIVGGLRILAAEMTVPDMLTFLLCIAVLVDPVQRLANFVRLWQEGYTGFVRAMEILEIAPDITDRPAARPMPAPRGEISFSNVAFGYEADGPRVLEQLSLTIAPGEFVSL
ncbi:ABC transporter ATP-binding protein, partial [Rhizobium ruizarguesonis]